MSKFYKQVATPETQGRQATAVRRPTQDSNARQEAMNEAGGLGGAIQSLLGTVNAGMQAVEKHDEESMAIMKDEKNIEATADADGTAEELKRRTEHWQEVSGVKLYDRSPEEMQNFINESITDIGSKHSGKWHKPLIMEKMKEKGAQFSQYITKKNRNDKFSTRIGQHSETILTNFKAASLKDAEAVSNFFKESVTDSLTELGRSPQEVATALLGSVFQNTILTSNANMAEILRSKEFKKTLSEEYDIKDLQATLNGVDQAMAPVINKQRTINSNRIKDNIGEMIMLGHASSKDIKEELKKQQEYHSRPENKVYSPSPSFWGKTLDDALKEQNETESYDALGKKVMGGEHTAIVSSTVLTEKQKVAATERLMFTQSGVDTTDIQAVTNDILGGGEKIATALNNGVTASESLLQQFKTPALISNNTEDPFDNIRGQTNAFIKLNGDTEDKLLEAVGAKSYNRILQQDHILKMIATGELPKVDGMAQLTRIASSLNENTSRLSGFKSEEGLLAIAEEPELEDRFRETAGDANMTWDVSKNQEQAFTFMSSTFHHFKNAGMDTEKAEEMTYKVFHKQYRNIENPDGSEVFLPKEFKDFDWDKVFEAVRHTDGIKDLYSKMSSFDKAWDGDLNVHVPRTYSSRKHVIIRLGKNDKLILDANAVNKMLKAYNTQDRAKKIQDYSVDVKSRKERLEKSQHVELLDNMNFGQ